MLYNAREWSDRVSAVHGRRAELERKVETNKGNNDRISEVVGSERYKIIRAIIANWLTDYPNDTIQYSHVRRMQSQHHTAQ